jgi:hypothetical protein
MYDSRPLHHLRIGTIIASRRITRGYLRLAAGPKVPKIWNEAFDGLKLPLYASFLNLAGHNEKPVVADMRTDPSFAACWDLALSQGVQAAWSVLWAQLPGDSHGASGPATLNPVPFLRQFRREYVRLPLLQAGKYWAYSLSFSDSVRERCKFL